MPSTYDPELVGSILGQIEDAIDTIRVRTRSIQRPDDFTATPEGREKLDSVCMLFMAIGAALKRVDRITDGAFLARHPEVDWKGAIGFRDITAHQYFDIDPEQVHWILTHNLDTMANAVKDLVECNSESTHPSARALSMASWLQCPGIVIPAGVERPQAKGIGFIEPRFGRQRWASKSFWAPKF